MLTVAIVATALALPGVSSAAPPSAAPAQDSVLLTGGPVQASGFTVFEINATSGPDGENPTGHTKFFQPEQIHGVGNLGGPVLCLAVRGNTATMNVQSEAFFQDLVTIQVVDAQPDTFDASLDVAPRAPTDCSPLPPTGFGGPLSSGDISVIDAQPLPTTKDQCKHGGWHNFPQFKNQGQCIRFVTHHATNGESTSRSSTITGRRLKR
jgi:hypothetical protein